MCLRAVLCFVVLQQFQCLYSFVQEEQVAAYVRILFDIGRKCESSGDNEQGQRYRDEGEYTVLLSRLQR